MMQSAPIEEVPTYTVLELRKKQCDYCLCVFVINEGEKIRRQLSKMAFLKDAIDIVIADGGSTDGSLDEAYLAQNGVRALLTKTGPGKLSAQMRMALSWALKQGYKGVVTIDGNDKDNPAAVPDFIAALEQGYDHVQGSRFIPGGRHKNTPLSRLLAVRLVHAPAISLAAHYRYTDTTNGFRAYSRKLLCDPRVRPFRDVFMRYELHYYLAIRAARLHFRCCELPVERVYPASGKVPTKISPLRGNLLVLKTLLSACLGRFDPHVE
jgi:glycosyltransferase involved in cell wall biosynthesis